jgi:demethylmenaquinone methyltransferase/2-methoxy-6-polyprenyl-1,4-benzoquinol methylase
MVSYYISRAPEYDEIYLRPERQADLRSIEKWVQEKFTPGARVLEVACGTGYWTRLLATTASHLVAVDASQATMDIARGRVPKEAVTFQKGDAYDLPLDLGKFDAAFAGFWFSHVPKARRRDFLCGLDSMLIPGSPVVLLDNLYVHGSSSPVVETDAEGNTYQARKLRDGSTHRVLKNFPSESEVRSSLDDLGFRSTFTAWQYYWACEYVREC